MSNQTEINSFGRKMSDVRLLFQALVYIAQDDLIPWVTTCPINQGSHLLQSEIIATHHCVNSYEL